MQDLHLQPLQPRELEWVQGLLVEQEQLGSSLSPNEAGAAEQLVRLLGVMVVSTYTRLSLPVCPGEGRQLPHAKGDVQ